MLCVLLNIHKVFSLRCKFQLDTIILEDFRQSGQFFPNPTKLNALLLHRGVGHLEPSSYKLDRKFVWRVITFTLL